MQKNILVVTGSPRKNGNTNALADEFVKGALKSGAIVNVYDVGKMKIGGCIACEYCFKNLGQCSQKDDMQKIYPDFGEAETIIFATPLYFYGFTSQLKAFIDRMFAFYKKGYNIKNSALLILCGDDNPDSLESAINEYKAFSSHMKLNNLGVVSATNVTQKGEIKNSIALTQAFEFGEKIGQI